MKQKNTIFILTCTLLILGLSGCANMSLYAAWSLHDVDYTRVDLRQTRLALALPKGAILDEASISLKFSVENEIKLNYLIDLEIIKQGREFAPVGFPDDLGTGLVIRIPEGKVDLVENYQRQLKLAQTNSVRGSASIGIDSRLNQTWLTRYCSESEPKGNTSRSLPIQAWLQVDEAQGFIKVYQGDAIFNMLLGESQNICTQQPKELKAK